MSDMKFFSLLSFSWFLANCTFFEYRNNLIYSCRRIIDQNLKVIIFDKPSASQMAHLIQFYENDPIALLNIVRWNGNRQVSCFIIGILTLKPPVDFSYWDIYKIYSNISLPKFFFQKCRILMNRVCKRRDWAKAKEILEILLSIQRQYLYHLEASDLARAKRWINEYESILHTFDPSDMDAFLRLFRQIQSIAISCYGNFSAKFFYLKLINRFKIFRYHALNRYWKKLNVNSCPPKLLYLIVHDFNGLKIFNFLYKSSIHLFYIIPKAKSFKRIIADYEALNDTRVDTRRRLQFLKEFCKYLHSYTKKDETPLKFQQRKLIKEKLRIIVNGKGAKNFGWLTKKQHWFMEVVLRTLSIDKKFDFEFETIQEISIS
jgi:hypothetical protein